MTEEAKPALEALDIRNAKEWIEALENAGINPADVGVPGAYPPSAYYMRKAREAAARVDYLHQVSSGRREP